MIRASLSHDPMAIEKALDAAFFAVFRHGFRPEKVLPYFPPPKPRDLLEYYRAKGAAYPHDEAFIAAAESGMHRSKAIRVTGCPDRGGNVTEKYCIRWVKYSRKGVPRQRKGVTI